MGEGASTDLKGQPIAEVKVGSVVIPIYYSPVTVKVKPAQNGAGQSPSTAEPAVKTYDSYLIPHYEGSERVVNRRNTEKEARKYAKEVAMRLSREGSRAEFLNDLDRRIYSLAQAAVQPLGMAVDEVCRRYVELQRRLKEGTLEEAVDFKNEHGQRVRLGATTQEVTKHIIRPTLELKAFSGVRTEKIVRLWWPMVAEAEEKIRVPDAVGKINARQAPILPNLKKRLEAYSAESKRGRVAIKWSSANSLYHAWQRLCEKAGVPYRRNGFRNSYFTYRLVIVEDPKTVAEEGGISETMLKKNYLSRAPVSKAMAEEWFSL